MKRLIVSFLLAGFILWILPLGFFIKPSQQNLACDGQRAMCMCHIMIPKSLDKAMDAGINLKTASANNENSSGGGANYFVSSKPVIVLHAPLASFFENQHLSYNNPCLAALEYVPKV